MINLIENILNYVFVPIFVLIWAIFSVVTKFIKDISGHAYQCAVKHFGRLLFKVLLVLAVLQFGSTLV
jgi:hypothetical protein